MTGVELQGTVTTDDLLLIKEAAEGECGCDDESECMPCEARGVLNRMLSLAVKLKVRDADG
jgi:hypothetical protein